MCLRVYNNNNKYWSVIPWRPVESELHKINKKMSNCKYERAPAFRRSGRRDYI